MQSQVRFSTGSGEGCREGPGEGFGNLWCRVGSGSTGSTRFPALGFAACFRKIFKNETLQLLGIPPKLFCLSKMIAAEKSSVPSGNPNW